MRSEVFTFLLTDVVASTRHWRESPDASAVMSRQRQLISAAVSAFGGVSPPDQGEGDSTLAVFTSPANALRAAVEAQKSLGAESWPETAPVRVRMSVHSGEAERLENDNYGGLPLIRAARLRSLASGGEVLVSRATAALVADHLPEGVELECLGPADLPGFEIAEQVHSLRHPDMAAASSLRLAPRAGAARGLAPWPTSLIGRVQERKDVALAIERSRIVTITGVGGSGKTRLAHAVATSVSDDFPGGVAWVELASLTRDDQVATRVADVCGVVEEPGVDPLTLLENRLADVELLLVLDNCEHLMVACAALAESLVGAAPGLRILATSREPLSVAGETSWRIPSLSVPPGTDASAKAIEGFDAVRLFVERAQAARADFEFDDVAAPWVLRICQRLDGIPLALELAAARVRSLSLEGLSSGLDERFRLLTGGARTSVARQRTLIASVEWSHDLLDARERALFRRLSVFVAPFALAAAETVAASGDEVDAVDVFDLLSRLVDKSLIVHEGDRYRVLETLRHFGLERAGEAGELEALRERHQCWCEQQARSWGAGRLITTRRMIAQIEAELPDLVAALEWSLAKRRPSIPILEALVEVWYVRVKVREIQVFSERVLGCYEAGSVEWIDVLSPMTTALFVAGVFDWVPTARAIHDASPEAFPLRARSFLVQGLFVDPAELLRAGVAVSRRLVEDAREAGSEYDEVHEATKAAILLAETGRLEEARPLLSWLDRRLPPDATLRDLLMIPDGNCRMWSGDLSGARALFERRNAVDSQPAGGAGCLSIIALLAGDDELAEGVDGWFDTRSPLGLFAAFPTFTRGVRGLLRDDLPGARAALREACKLPSLGAIQTPHYVLGQAAALDQDVSEARRVASELENLVGDANSPLQAVFAHLIHGRADLDSDPASAEDRAHRALGLALEHGMSLVASDALELLSEIAARGGARDQAARLLGAVEAFRKRSGYVWRPGRRDRDVQDHRRALEGSALLEGRKLSLEDAAEYAMRGRGERGRPKVGWGSLTPTERRVVDLAARGQSNKAIAEALFVSVATIKSHLIHVYRKLDIRSRAELAALATRRELAAEEARDGDHRDAE